MRSRLLVGALVTGAGLAAGGVQMSYALEQRDATQPLVHARRLAELEPANPEVRRLVERLAAGRP